MNATWVIREVSWPLQLADTVRVLAASRETAWLDSADADEAHASPGSRTSLIGVEPIGVLTQAAAEDARLSIAGRVVATAMSGWKLWRQASRGTSRLPACPVALSPGWIGTIGFEAAGQLERLPGSHLDDFGLPLLRMALYDRGVVLDHAERRAYLVAASGVRSRYGLEEVAVDALVADWEQAIRTTPRTPHPETPRLRFEMARTDYERMIERALAYIAAGDIYQVNLAQRLRFEGVGDALDAYDRLRRVNPAPYAALLRWDQGAIGSFSPELFLRKRGREVLTQPIKGTRPRTGDAVLDAAYREELIESAKDAAELAMIIDLHRNDLGRVCEYGSVRVCEARRVEAHPTVFHTVADVAGRLRADRDGLDLLAACFPAGSISGVPKIRALEIIDELEPVARGAYTGAVGVLGLDGNLTFNVAIRTLQFRGDTAILHVGGGIVVDSDPADEHEETLAKARGIVRALESIANCEHRIAN